MSQKLDYDLFSVSFCQALKKGKFLKNILKEASMNFSWNFSRCQREHILLFSDDGSWWFQIQFLMAQAAVL